MLNSLRIRLMAGALMITCATLAADTGIDVTKSTLIATFKQEGVGVDAPFKRFSGRIVYDPANPTAATASIDVDTASLDIGDPAYNEEVRKKDWLDSATYPKAMFRSTAIKPGAPGKFAATGNLTVKGRVLSITVPITAQKVGNAMAYDGTLTISRKAFVIGSPTWEDVVDDKVSVRFHLVN